MKKNNGKNGIARFYLIVAIAVLIGAFMTGGLLSPGPASASGTINNCTGCHGQPPADSLTLSRGTPTGAVIGSHNKHAGPWATNYGINCEVCHVAPNWTTTNHRNGMIEVNLRWRSINASGVASGGSVTGWGSYSKGSWFTQVPNPTFGSCRGTYCHSNGTSIDGLAPNAGSASPPMWSTVPTSAKCTNCHGNQTGTVTGAPWYTNTKANSHRLHAWQTLGTPTRWSTGPVCDICHYTTTSDGTTITSVGRHVNRIYDVVASSVSFTYTYSTLGGTCQNPSCHVSTGGSIIKRWGSNSGAAQCVKCHGVPTATPAQYTADNNVAAPGYTSVGRSTWNTTGTIVNNVSSDAKVGAHDSHLRNLKGYTTMTRVVCQSCHDMAARVNNIWVSTHQTGNTEFVWSSFARNAGNFSPHWNTLTVVPWYSTGNDTCGNVYCHGETITDVGVKGTGWATLFWSNQTWLTAAASAKDVTSCNRCHQSPPTRTTFFNHVTPGYTINTDCSGCHGHNGSGPKHIDGTFYGNADCTACHSAVQNAPNATIASGGVVTQRAAVAGEFGQGWGHRKLGRGPVSAGDCIVCHLEGVSSTQTRSTIHGDGYIHLRDPDVAGETQIKDMSGATYSFVQFWTTYAAGSRTQNGHMANTVDNILTQNFCLKCHDSNGAQNPTAWNSTAGWTAASAFMPWGGVNLGATWTTINGAAQTGGVVDVKSSFSTINSSYHPVLGPLNKDFPSQARLNTPYNNNGRWGSSGVKTLSVVLNCFDCHNAPTTPWLNRTVISHGSTTANHLRGNIYSSTAPVLCTVCHAATYASGTGGHGAGSAFGQTASSASSHTASTFALCNTCHLSTTSTTAPARPKPGQDFHGFNRLNTGTDTDVLWPTGVTENYRPFGFLRNTVQFTTATAPRPFRVANGIGSETALTTGTASCGGATSCDTHSMTNYSPGGSY